MILNYYFWEEKEKAEGNQTRSKKRRNGNYL